MLSQIMNRIELIFFDNQVGSLVKPRNQLMNGSTQPVVTFNSSPKSPWKYVNTDSKRHDWHGLSRNLYAHVSTKWDYRRNFFELTNCSSFNLQCGQKKKEVYFSFFFSTILLVSTSMCSCYRCGQKNQTTKATRNSNDSRIVHLLFFVS